MGEAPLERELERTKRLLRLVLETGALNAAYVDRDRRHTWVHNSSDEPSEEEILGRTDMELFDEGMARPTSDTKQDAMESESRVNREFTFIKPWGQNRYRAAAEPLYDETGDVEGAMFAAVDISEQYRLLNRTTDAIYTVDEDWRVTFWNDRMATRTEIDPRDIVGENLWEAFGDDIPDELERRYREVMATGEPAEFEQYVPDPFDYWLELRVFADGNGLSIHSRDITERKEQEQRLTDQRDNLDVLNQVLRHDVRNDLHVVLAYADALVDSVDGEDGEYARKIVGSAEHAVDLTTTARGIAEVFLTESTDPTPVRLEAALDRAVTGVRSTYDDAIVRVPSIPDTSVLCNEMLDSVFRNLLKNAVQHNDSEVPEVEVTVSEREETVVVRVADNGPGVPDDQREAVFGKGEKGLDSAGTGIGLYLVRRLVENCDGHVSIEDGPVGDGSDLEGAVFAVELPSAEAS
jgi:PAS domain S-box-containing protein